VDPRRRQRGRTQGLRAQERFVVCRCFPVYQPLELRWLRRVLIVPQKVDNAKVNFPLAYIEQAVCFNALANAHKDWFTTCDAAWCMLSWTHFPKGNIGFVYQGHLVKVKVTAVTKPKTRVFRL